MSALIVSACDGTLSGRIVVRTDVRVLNVEVRERRHGVNHVAVGAGRTARIFRSAVWVDPLVAFTLVVHSLSANSPSEMITGVPARAGAVITNDANTATSRRRHEAHSVLLTFHRPPTRKNRGS